MKLKLKYFHFIILTMVSFSFYGQDISLYQQFNGRFDFTFIGNTLNLAHNSNLSGQPNPPCAILTSSAASLNLGANDTVEAAYLYWAGSGKGDFEVKLNNIDLTPDRTFNATSNFGLIYFAAFKDITTIVQTAGNGSYLFSDLDLTAVIPGYCETTTNFGGWAMIVIYKNTALPLNQLNVYDGLQLVPDEVNITLNSLNVIDNQDAKIGFLAWEGDINIANNESLRINGSLIGNPPLNPFNNAFNGTNSFTGDSNLYNMDLDFYNIQNNIAIGDTSAEIQLTSGQDVVLINAIVTKLNSQLPDATITFEQPELECNSRKVIVNYTVSNLNSTAVLPAGIPIAIYVNGQFIEYTETINNIPIGGDENSTISIQIPDNIPDNFVLLFAVDDNGSGRGIVAEINEDNNTYSANIQLTNTIELPVLDSLVSCNLGLGKGVFDFSSYEDLLIANTTDTVTFYPSLIDLENNTNGILNITNYNAINTPTTIFVKIDNNICFKTTSFLLTTKNCQLIVYNYISTGIDTYNDTFKIDGLRGIFLNYKLSVFNRWGALIWTGNNNTPEWNGYANEGLLINNKEVANGTYYYSLELNDSNYPEPIYGYLYIKR